MVLMAKTKADEANKVKEVKRKPTKPKTKKEAQIIITGTAEILETVKAIIVSHTRPGDIKIMEGKK